jgi:hypothetical protein
MADVSAGSTPPDGGTPPADSARCTSSALSSRRMDCWVRSSSSTSRPTLGLTGAPWGVGV